MSVSGQCVVEIDAILGEGLEENDSDHEHQIAEATAFLGFSACLFCSFLVDLSLLVEGRLIFFKTMEALKSETGEERLGKAIARIMADKSLLQ